MNNTSIYGLVDPRRPDWVMYVGKGLEKRVNFHWKFFVRNGKATNALLRRWFEQLKADGVEPSFIFLEENVSDWQEAEREWIAAWRQVNSQLCNVRDGGNDWPAHSKSMGGKVTQMIMAANPGKYRKIRSELGRQRGLKGGRNGGIKVHQVHKQLMLEASRKGGLVGGSKAGKIGGRRCHELHPELASLRALKAHKLHPKLAHENGTKACHRRWHLNRGIVSPVCSFCLKEVTI